MSGYDERQYKIMLEILDLFEARRLDLGKVIADLEALVWCLQDAEKTWKDSFHNSWEVLEDVYADSLDKGFMELPPDHQKLIDDAVRNMRQLLAEVLAKSDER